MLEVKASDILGHRSVKQDRVPPGEFIVSRRGQSYQTAFCGDALRYSDALLLPYLVGMVAQMIHGSHVAIVGSGNGIKRARTRDTIAANNHTVIIGLNQASRTCAEWKIPGAKVLALQFDYTDEPVAEPSKADGWILSEPLRPTFPAAHTAIYCPYPMPLGPMGSQGLAVWLCRLMGATMVTCYACDGVKGDTANSFTRKQSPNYRRHCENALTYAMHMPIRWLCPYGVPRRAGRVVIHSKYSEGFKTWSGLKQ